MVFCREQKSDFFEGNIFKNSKTEAKGNIPSVDVDAGVIGDGGQTDTFSLFTDEKMSVGNCNLSEADFSKSNLKEGSNVIFDIL